MTWLQPASFSISALISPVCAPFGVGVAILAAERDAGAGDLLGKEKQQRRRRTDQDIAGDRLAGLAVGSDRAMRELARQSEAVFVPPVHLPIAGDKLPPRHHSLLQPSTHSRNSPLSREARTRQGLAPIPGRDDGLKQAGNKPPR